MGSLEREYRDDGDYCDFDDANKIIKELEQKLADAEKEIKILKQTSPYAQTTTGMELLQKLSHKRSVIDRRPLGEKMYWGDDHADG